MEKNKFYSLPELSYNYDSLEPHISKEQLTIHHQKHHAAYVKGANLLLEKIDERNDLDIKATLKELSFQIGGHVLHSLFWENVSPIGDKEPQGELSLAIERNFGSFDDFKKDFNKNALSIEGSGWAALVYNKDTERLLMTQIEKHNVNLYPELKILMVLDFWEHAYYLDYKNEKAKFLEAFWNIVNWDEIGKRLTKYQQIVE